MLFHASIEMTDAISAPDPSFLGDLFFVKLEQLATSCGTVEGA
jgi:hypothetical protein